MCEARAVNRLQQVLRALVTISLTLAASSRGDTCAARRADLARLGRSSGVRTVRPEPGCWPARGCWPGTGPRDPGSVAGSDPPSSDRPSTDPANLRLVGVAGPLLRERPLEELALWRGVDTPLLCSDTKVGDAGAAPCPWTVTTLADADASVELLQRSARCQMRSGPEGQVAGDQVLAWKPPGTTACAAGDIRPPTAATSALACEDPRPCAVPAGLTSAAAAAPGR